MAAVAVVSSVIDIDFSIPLGLVSSVYRNKMGRFGKSINDDPN